MIESPPHDLEADLQQFWADYAKMLEQRLNGAPLGEVVINLDAITGLASLFATQASSVPDHPCPEVYLYFPWLNSFKDELSVPYFRRDGVNLESESGHEISIASEGRDKLDQLTKSLLTTRALSPLQNLTGDGVLTMTVFYGNGESEPVHKIVLMNEAAAYEI